MSCLTPLVRPLASGKGPLSEIWEDAHGFSQSISLELSQALASVFFNPSTSFIHYSNFHPSSQRKAELSKVQMLMKENWLLPSWGSLS